MVVLVVMVLRTLLRFSLALLSILCVLACFGKGLGVQDEIEVAEVLLTLTCEVDGHHHGNFVVAC